MNRKEAFIAELKEKLEKEQVDNIDEIIKIYERRFQIGYDAKMSDKDIINALGSIDEIVAKEKRKHIKNQVTVDVNLDLAYFSDFKIELVSELGVRFEVSKDILQYIDFTKSENEITIKNKSSTLFKVKKKYIGRLLIGPNISFNNFKINNLTADIELCDIKANDIVINNTSGDITIDKLESKDINISSTSGDITINSMKCSELIFNSVSGDSEIIHLNSNRSSLNTVSGDIIIRNGICDEYSLSSISGDITIQSGNTDEAKISSSSISGDIVICGRSKENLVSKLKKTFKGSKHVHIDDDVIDEEEIK